MKNPKNLPDLSPDAPTDDGSPDHAQSTEKWIATATLGLVVILTAMDVLSDFSSGATPLHLFTEIFVIVLGLVGIALIWRRAILSWRSRTETLTLQLSAARDEAARWQGEARRHLEGLGAEIEKQFDAWKLSPAEKEIGILLLKGLSLQEIADLRKVSERTVRQQAQALYQKAGLRGRADLSAFFLEDLLLPSQRSTDPLRV